MIRESRPADQEAVLALWLQTNLTAHGFIPASYWQSQYPAVKEMLPGARLYVWEEGGAVLGFIGLTGDYVAGLFVGGGHQSKGVGKALLNHAKTGRAALSLRVYQKNERAVRFYLREGFCPAGQGVDQATGETELHMRWARG